MARLQEESFHARKKLSCIDVLRMNAYQILSLKLHFAILARKKVFNFNLIFSAECFTQLKDMTKNITLEEAKHEKLIIVPMLIMTLDVFILFWTVSTQHVSCDDMKLSIQIDRRRSRSITSSIDRCLPFDKQLYNSHYLCYLCMTLLNYLGNRTISDPSFYVKNFDKCVNYYFFNYFLFL